MNLAHTAAALADAGSEVNKRGLLRSALWMWVGFAALGAVVVLVVWVIASGAARRIIRERRRVRRPSAIKDPWAEAGRRAEPISPDEESDDEMAGLEDGDDDGDGP